MSEEFQHLRERIDALDLAIVRLLNERAGLALAIGRYKAQNRGRVFVPERESDVLAHVEAASRGPLRSEHVRAIYREILSACRSLEAPMKVAFLGPPATFTHQAAQVRFGEQVDYVPAGSISEVFGLVHSGEVAYGVVPLENSTEGSVHETLDLLVETDLKVCWEVTLPIVHCLMARVPREAIQKVYTHPQAAAQCRRWLGHHLPGVEIVPVASTARAAEQAAADPTGAAIAPELAATVYGLDLLDRGIQDLTGNYTRFLVLGTVQTDRPTGRDRTAIVFSIKDRVGALRDVLSGFADEGINLTSIQSRPSKKRAWDYVFFVELEGHRLESHVERALARAQEYTAYLKVLGSWPGE